MESIAIDHRHIDMQRLRVALADPTEFAPSKADKKWLPLVARLPAALRQALLGELDRGNTITSIQGGDWPQPGSIMVLLAQPPAEHHTVDHPELTLRHMNDPRYWMTDLSQTVDGVDYMLAN